MTNPTPSSTSLLPARVVVGGYSIEADGDGPAAGTGLRVLDLALSADPEAPAYGVVAHENLLSPTWVVRHPTRPWLVSVGEAAPSELVCSQLGDDGSLAVLDRHWTTGDFGCHLALSEDGRLVVVAHYGSGTVESFALDDEGRFSGPVDRFRSSAPLGPDAERQDGPHAHQVVSDPGRPGELLVCDLGTDRIHRLRLDQHGSLAEAAESVELPPGSGPRHLVVAGDTLVVACELSVELWVGRRDAARGWRHTQTVPTTGLSAEERGRATEPVLPSEVRLVGDRVLVATRGVDTVSVFDLDRERGEVTFVAEVSCGGRHPRDLVVTDGLVWVANQGSDEIAVLDLAAVVAGRPQDPEVTISGPRPACVVMVPSERTTA